MKSKYLMFGAAACAALFLFSCFMLYRQYADEKQSAEAFCNISALVRTETPPADDPQESEAEIPVQTAYEKYAAVYERNNDFAGWISIDGTNIDYPVMQSIDNPNYYLKHNFEKEYSDYGVPYVQENCALGISDNCVLYGHHMKNGSMFADLTKYRSLSFYRQNPTLEFSTLYKKSTYKVYAVFVLNASKSDDNNYIYNISRKSFANDEDFESWSGEAYERSLINTGVDVNKDDNIITLVTCVYDFDDARLVVMARETREDEDASVDTSAAKANPSPRYPKRWYDDRGIKYPFE